MPELNKVAIFTNEYPPYIYGGAGVHVEYLSRALSEMVPVEVRAWGDQTDDVGNLRVRGYGPWDEASQNTDPRFKGALDALHRSLRMAKDDLGGASVVHCHTWYTFLAGFWAKQLWGIPLVVTIHSLEPLRPWKAEQLGNAYHTSSWMERTGIENADAVIAVSNGTRADILQHFDIAPEKVHVIYNGIDLDEYQRDAGADVLLKHGIDPERPFVLFVGRITRQKGIIHLVNAIPAIDPALQIVLCAGAPDTREIGDEMQARVSEVSAGREGIIWIQEMLPRPEIIQLYSQATVFCCPSVYEPFGIINLEAMACETAVVASAIGGIPEVVVPGETGILIDLPLKPGTFEPVDAAGFSRDLAAAVNDIAGSPELQARYGAAGRKRVEEHFSWGAIARETVELYRALVE